MLKRRVILSMLLLISVLYMNKLLQVLLAQYMFEAEKQWLKLPLNSNA